MQVVARSEKTRKSGLGLPVIRPATVETTALGAALLAGLGCGVYRQADELKHALRTERIFEPQQSADWAAEKRAAWEAAVARTGG